MEILKQSKQNRTGNDFRYTSDIFLVQSLGYYFVLKHQTVVGCVDVNEVMCTDPTINYDVAYEQYLKFGGKE